MRRSAILAWATAGILLHAGAAGGTPPPPASHEPDGSATGAQEDRLPDLSRPLLRARPAGYAAEPALSWTWLWQGVIDLAQPAGMFLGPGARLALWLPRSIDRFVGLFMAGEGGTMPGVARPGVLVMEPVEGVESSGYGQRRDPITGRRKQHKGVDYRAPRGTPVRAAGPGVVVFAGYRGSYGRLVVIDHGMGLETRYAHLRRIKVERGESVDAGAQVGTVGSSGRSTGPHLHFEVRQLGEPVNPLWALGVQPSHAGGELGATLGWLAPSPQR